ncbi:MAG: hypothetical protein DVB22_000865 [Verrucomicrobia bacterium]|nr:MAG: hypothetical protein DVB22_000865 [Verrucomicrobiota bacterium]
MSDLHSRSRRDTLLKIDAINRMIIRLPPLDQIVFVISFDGIATYRRKDCLIGDQLSKRIF